MPRAVVPLVSLIIIKQKRRSFDRTPSTANSTFSATNFLSTQWPVILANRSGSAGCCPGRDCPDCVCQDRGCPDRGPGSTVSDVPGTPSSS